MLGLGLVGVGVFLEFFGIFLIGSEYLHFLFRHYLAEPWIAAIWGIQGKQYPFKYYFHAPEPEPCSVVKGIFFVSAGLQLQLIGIAADFMPWFFAWFAS